MRSVLLSLYIAWLTNAALLGSAKINGRVTNANGAPMAYASIYVSKLNMGTTTNSDGFYTLTLPAGAWLLMAQSLGFVSEQKMVKVESSDLTTDFVLNAQSIVLPEIRVTKNNEDPANYILRHAIAMGPYYRNQVSEYQCRVYLKGAGTFNKIPALLRKRLEKEGVKQDLPIVSETISEVSFALPDKVTQKVIATHTSKNNMNVVPMSMVTSSLYDAEKYDMISPFDKRAFSVYRFVLEGAFSDMGRTIHKIRVEPRRKGADLFAGYICVADAFWNIHSANLDVTIPSGTGRMHLMYSRITDEVWMPVNLNYKVNAKAWGFDITFNYVASVSDYKTKLNPALDHSFLGRTEKKVAEEQKALNELTGSFSKPVTVVAADISKKEMRKKAREMADSVKKALPRPSLEIEVADRLEPRQIVNDSLFWASVRTIPLDTIELVSFVKKDSISKIATTQAYRDSVENYRKRFKAKYLLFGKKYDYSLDSVYLYKTLQTGGILNPGALAYNTVDGVRYDTKLEFNYSDSTGIWFKLKPFAGYAFGRQRADFGIESVFRTNGLTGSTLFGGLGSKTKDFNTTSGHSAFMNSIYTLFTEQNYNKYFRNDYAYFGYRRELINGLQASVSGSYNNYFELQNHNTYSFVDVKNREFTSNIPEYAGHIGSAIKGGSAAGLTFEASYTPFHRYYIRNNIKRHVQATYPTFLLKYAGTFGDANKLQSRFDYLEAGIKQTIDLGLGNKLSYVLQAGSFTNNERVHFSEYRHFSTAPLLVSMSNECDFYLLPFYKYATDKSFVLALVKLKSDRLLIKRIPFLAGQSFGEELKAAYLNTPDLNHYTEVSYGLNGLFLMFDVKGVVSFTGSKFQQAGFRLSLPLSD